MQVLTGSFEGVMGSHVESRGVTWRVATATRTRGRVGGNEAGEMIWGKVLTLLEHGLSK